MPKDDYYVLTCKLLGYLYDCLKNGKTVDVSLLKHNTRLFPINEQYWHYVMTNIAKSEWVTGIITADDIDNAGDFAIITQNIKITPAGIAFLQDNSLSAKAMKTLKEIKDLPFNVLDIFKG